ncbi:MAG: histidine kinase dimerization/phospho-acceptor domain-containing protein, partial [Myxococcota bacterium]
MKVGIRGKLVAVSLLVITVIGLTSGAVLESRLRDELTSRLEDTTRREVETARAAVSRLDPADVAAFTRLADTLGQAHRDADIAIIARDGRLLGHSAGAKGPDGRFDLSAPDVADALRQGVGVTRRRDGDERVDTLFVSAAYPNATTPRGVVRYALRLSEVASAVDVFRTLMAFAVLIGLVTATFMSGVAGALVTRTLRTFAGNAVSLVRGERSEEAPLISTQDMGQLAGSLSLVSKELQAAVGELAGERDRLQTILECMGEAVVTFDDDGRITLANSAAEHLLGLQPDHHGQPLLDLVALPALGEAAVRTRAGESATIEFEVPHPPHRRVVAHAAPLKTVGGAVVVMHDITEVRKLERMRRDFVANVSHELRTPIAVIRANTETLLRGALEEDGPHRHRFVDGIHRNADR